MSQNKMPHGQNVVGQNVARTKCHPDKMAQDKMCKVNVPENQVNTLKVAIRLKKGATICFPKGGIRGEHVLLLTPVQINRLDKAQAEGRGGQIRMSARQVAKDVSYTGGFFAA